MNWLDSPGAPHLKNTMKNLGILINDGPWPCGINGVQVALRPSIGIGIGIETGPGRAGSPALMEGPGCPEQEAVSYQKAGEAQGQCLAKWGRGGEGLVQILNSQMPLKCTLGLSIKELEAKIGLYFRGPR